MRQILQAVPMRINAEDIRSSPFNASKTALLNANLVGFEYKKEMMKEDLYKREVFIR